MTAESEHDESAELIAPGLSSGDVSDVAQEFDVDPDQLVAFARTPEFERMVEEELARRAEQGG